MAWYEYVGLAVGVLASIQAARLTVWRWARGAYRGARAVGKFGEALPKLSAIPEQVAELSIQVAAGRQELRDHMKDEDAASLSVEKVLVNLITRQEKLEIGQQRIGHDLNTVRQIVMNNLDAGSGDRWRISHHLREETVMEPVTSTPLNPET